MRQRTIIIVMAIVLVGLILGLVVTMNKQNETNTQIQQIPQPTTAVQITAEPTRELGSPIEEVYQYVIDNGVKPTDFFNSQYGDSYYAIEKKISDNILVSITASNDIQNTIFLNYIMTIMGVNNKFAVKVFEDEEYFWGYTQVGGKNISGSGWINPANYEMSVDSSNNSTNENLVYIAKMDLKVLLPQINELLSENGLSYGYEDFSFSSSIKTMEIEVPQVVPAPISININKVMNNSIGTPEAFIQFTNTSDKKLIAFDFYVKCYDAYGEVVKGYGTYDYYTGTYDMTLNSGSTSSNDFRWTLYGHDNTKTIEVAIVKYKLEGEETVEIPSLQRIWVGMN